MYLKPKVVYRNPDTPRVNSIVRYFGNRVLRNNKNFMCAVTGQTGVGKSWATGSIQEIYSNMYDIPYNPENHVMFSLKQLMKLIHNKEIEKKIQFGSTVMIDELQIEANARTWQSQMNLILNRITSTFRNQRLVVFFVTPAIEMIDKQSRILFHAEFKVEGFDKNTGITKIKPHFLEWYAPTQEFYKHCLIECYALHGKRRYGVDKIGIWEVNKPSDTWIDIYEQKKLEFSNDLNKKLYKDLIKDQDEDEIKDNYNYFNEIVLLYNQYGENYHILTKKYPQIPIRTLERYIYLIKRSNRTIEAPQVPTIST